MLLVAGVFFPRVFVFRIHDHDYTIEQISIMTHHVITTTTTPPPQPHLFHSESRMTTTTTPRDDDDDDDDDFCHECCFPPLVMAVCTYHSIQRAAHYVLRVWCCFQSGIRWAFMGNLGIGKLLVTRICGPTLKRPTLTST